MVRKIKLSKGFKYSLIIIFLLTMAFLAYNFLWVTFDDYKQLKKDHVVLKKVAAKDTRVLAELKEATLKSHELKDEEIASLKEDIVKIDRQKDRLSRIDDAKDLEIRKLRKEHEALQDPKKIIANLELQVKSWEGRFWNERSDKEASEKAATRWASIAGKNFGKYINEKILREAVEVRLRDEITLRKSAEAINKSGDKIIRSLSLKFNLKNILYTAGGFVAGVIVGGKK